MSLDKAIKHGKEKRKPYTGSKAFDRQCCNHGGCDRCHENRLHSTRRRLLKAEAGCDNNSVVQDCDT